MTLMTATAEYQQTEASRRSDAQGLWADKLAGAGAAHDLGNYLQVISSAVRIIERSLSVEARAALEPVVRGAHVSLERACCLTHQVAAGCATRRSTEAQLDLSARLEALQPVIELAVGPAVRVEYHLGGDTPEVVCDGAALDDAIMNLVVNASRAMPEGGRLSIDLSHSCYFPDDMPGALIRIADTGCGMSPETAARAFEAGVTSKSDARGSGLGLATVAAFAGSAGGYAAIESRLGIGTIVTIGLPGVLKTVKRCRPL